MRAASLVGWHLVAELCLWARLQPCWISRRAEARPTKAADAILQLTRSQLLSDPRLSQIPLSTVNGSPAETTAQSPRELLLLLTLAGMQFTNIVDFMILMPLAPQ